MAQRRDFSEWTVADVERRNAAIAARQGKPHTPPEMAMEMQQEPPKSKYRNKAEYVEGIRFASGAEAKQWVNLRLLERSGEIKDLKRQVPFELLCPCYDATIDQITRCPVVERYMADFTFRDAQGRFHVQDVKSEATRKTQMYLLKKRWLYLQSGIEIEEIT